MTADSSPVISWPVIVVLVIFIIMVLIPFFIAMRELFKPKDNTPLFINMLHSKDPLYFGKAFKKIIREAIEKKGILPGISEIQLSKKERVEICAAKSVPPHSIVTQIIYVSGDLHTDKKTIFTKEIYVKGMSNIEKKNVLRALYSEKDIFLDTDCRISRWVCSEGSIRAGEGCKLGRSIACKGQLQLEPGCRFEAAFGRPLVTFNGNKPGPGLAGDFIYPAKIPVKKEVAWKISRKHLSINCPDDREETRKNGKDEKKENQYTFNNPWFVSDKEVIVPAFSVVESNFVARKSLVIGENSKICASIKAYRDITIEKDTVVYGEIFAEGDIKIAENCVLLGNVFSQGKIFIGSGVRLSRPDSVKSVIGKKRIELGKNVVVYGYMLTEGVGIVR